MTSCDILLVSHPYHPVFPVLDLSVLLTWHQQLVVPLSLHLSASHPSSSILQMTHFQRLGDTLVIFYTFHVPIIPSFLPLIFQCYSLGAHSLLCPSRLHVPIAPQCKQRGPASLRFLAHLTLPLSRLSILPSSGSTHGTLASSWASR